ncbi:RE1, partial [Symbiodinium necroappetens]
SGLEGRDLLKILPKPDAFKCDKADDEHSKWHAWWWTFRQYLVAVDPSFDGEIATVERSLNTPVVIMSAEQQARSFQLYALLSALIKGRAFQTVKQISGQQGYEALRMLLLQYQPASRVRSLGILSALTQIKGFNSKEPYLPQILELERAFEQYAIASGEDVQSSLKSALLLRSLSGVMRQHICAALPEDASYSVLREAVLRYERVQFKWGVNNVFAQDSVLLGHRQHHDESTPMEIDRVGNVGKGKYGKPGHGKGNKGKVEREKEEERVDLTLMSVETVVAVVADDGQQSQAVNRVYASVAESDEEIDLTVFSCAGPVQVQSGPVQVQSGVEVDEVTEVVLDSGYAADVSQPASFSDAQGNPLKAYGWRYAQVVLDNGVTFRERFLVTDVTSPLLACGKLYKAGWSVQHMNNELVLTKGSRRVPVRFRHNSLVVEGSIRAVMSKPEACRVRVVSLSPVLERMVENSTEFFEELIPGVYGLKCESNAYLDVGLYLPREGMQYRTTLVCVNKANSLWELCEMCQSIATLDVLDEQFEDGAERTMLTIASREVLSPEQLGIIMPEAAGDGAAAVVPAGTPEGQADSDMPGTPDLEALFASDDDKGKQRHDDKDVPMLEQAALEASARDDDETAGDFVEVNGVRIDADSALSVMRKACEYLNIGRSGGKAKVYKRLCQHLKQMQLAESVRLKQAKAQAEEREPREVPLVREPTQHERLKHCLTHSPYQPWCEFCVMHKARSDKAVTAIEPKRSVSVLSFDYGFTGRELDPENKLITLCVKDRDSGWRESIPTKRKGGPESLRYLTGEIVRLCNVLGYNDVTIRSDPEPSCRSLQNEIQKARGRLGQRTRLEQSGEEEKSSNGAAEEAVAATRQQSCVLLSAYEHHTGKKVGSQHPLHAWAVRHGSWILNRYCVSRDQQTPFEITFQTAMTNKPVKGSAKWVRSMWLGKANASDGHLVVTAGGKLLITRMRKQREPKAVEAEAGPEADEVGVLGPVSPLLRAGDEAGSDPESSSPSADVPPSGDAKDDDKSGAHSSDDAKSSASAPTPTADAHVEPMQDVESASAEPSVPIAGGDGGDTESATPVERPAKAARLQAVAQNDLYHNDAPIEFDFQNGELDDFEGYDYGLDDYYFSEEPDLADGPPDELWRPFTPAEPELTEDELFKVDSAADDFEIRRLLEMNVLEAMTASAAEQAQQEGSRLLSTKFVRSWRIKMRKLDNGREEQQYLRRSRFVGREYAWLDKDRTELFAPASSSLLTRLLPSVFMRNKDNNHACCVLDVADAFLTVDQRIPTIVRANLGSGHEEQYVQHFRLVKLLPGQRDGTVRWHEAFAEFLDGKLGLEPYVPCPALFRLKQVDVSGLLHVDDLFSEGARPGLETMVACVKEKYKGTVSWLCAHGDEVGFLKKSYKLVRDDLLIIQPHPRHVERLVEMFGLGRSAPKASPMPTTVPLDDVELDSERSTLFRTAVGILLHLQADVVEAQFGIRWLAQHMSRPTAGALRVLRHMILYLKGTSSYGIGFPVPTRGVGITVQSKSGLDVLETHTDADWAGDREHRRSVSGCVITLNGHMLSSSSSRTQNTIALSSGESEYASAVSGTCDQVFIRNAAEFVMRSKVESQSVA